MTTIIFYTSSVQILLQTFYLCHGNLDEVVMIEAEGYRVKRYCFWKKQQVTVTLPVTQPGKKGDRAVVTYRNSVAPSATTK